MIAVVGVHDVCRAPLAVAMVRAALAEAGVETELRSAGTDVRPGEACDAATRAIADQFGCGPLEHRATPLDKAAVASADLVLTMTRDVRRAVVALHPPAVQYAFTVRQLERILASGAEAFDPPSGTPSEVVVGLRTFAARNRNRALPRGGDADDLGDPYGRPRAVHEQVTRQMNPGLAALVSALGGTLPSWPRWH